MPYRPALAQSFFEWIRPTPADEAARRAEMWEQLYGRPETLVREKRPEESRPALPPAQAFAPFRRSATYAPPAQPAMLGLANSVKGIDWNIAAVVGFVGLVTVLELSGVTNIFGTRQP